MFQDYNKMYSRVVRYSHEAFEKESNRDPNDVTHRAVYADWLEEHAPDSITPAHLDRLRNFKGKMWVGRSPSGKVLAIPYVSKEHAMGGLSRAYHKEVRYSPRSGAGAYECRVNGKCKTWVTRPNEFQLPIKIGYKGTGYITHDNNQWLTESPTEEPTK